MRQPVPIDVANFFAVSPIHNVNINPGAHLAPSAPINCNERATALADAVELYHSLQRAASDSEDFELLSAAFNRRCAEDPVGVLRALEQEALIA